MAAIDISSQGAASPDTARRNAGPSKPRAERSIAYRAFMALSSLKITVTVFALAIFLIFVGTLAQVDKDIWQVMGQYFRAFYVWIPLQVFFPPSFFPSKPQVPGAFLYPGGFTLLAIALVNLTTAHALRFKVQ
ncbi:MAG TPA: hypothetical protein VHV77_09805, partial [Pirellulales bacterium]|nr:hypothetical protein [Pirellulales bacterium]